MQVYFGMICDVKPGFARVNLSTYGITTPWLPILKTSTIHCIKSSQFEINEQVACLLDEHCSNGLIMGAIHNNRDLPDPNEERGISRNIYSDGAILEYDSNTGNLSVLITQNIKLKSVSIEIVGEGTVNISATKLKVDGDLEVAGQINAQKIASEGDVVANQISLLTHTHIGVQPGTGISGIPQ
ncbi:phage baseplate assembly protein V [Chitinophaga skermanii]|uniref:Phage baseplate assembly protein V n=1 Tax=Chitinophaga skermanii TaxID=331697 RepID=A0A327QB94_9BACT|nr:phage baseplate assembly protein V [Chitinophaga skermanii]RAJ00473.1 phage baseplate assembly protein V [Chitinophaga skermanii]